MEDQVFHKPEAVWLLEDEKTVNRMESTVAVKMEPMPVLQDEIMEEDDPLRSQMRDIIQPTVEGHYNKFDSDAMSGAMPNVGEIQVEQVVGDKAGTDSAARRRRPSLGPQQDLLIALHKAKMDALILAKTHALEQNQREHELFVVRLAQENEKLNQEKVKSEILALQEHGVRTVPITFPGVKAELSKESGSDWELTHIKEEPDTVSDSEGASFDLKPVKREFCEGEAKEDESEDGRAHTPDGEQDMCCKLEIEDNNILEDSSGYTQSLELGGLPVRHKVAGSSVEAADNSEPNIEIRVQKGVYECHFCYMGFSRVIDLVQHTRKSHTGTKPFKCDHCKKCFKHKPHLNIHRRMHTGEKPFSCEHCNKCFTHISNLNTHRRTHTGEKPSSCEYCNKCFAQSSALIAHRRTHTGEKPFCCEHCNKCFTHSSNLNTHRRTHTREKPFSCECCKKCFKQRSTLINHVRTHRGE